MPVAPLNRSVSSDTVDVKIVWEPEGYGIKRDRKPIARGLGGGALFGLYPDPATTVTRAITMAGAVLVVMIWRSARGRLYSLEQSPIAEGTKPRAMEDGS